MDELVNGLMDEFNVALMAGLIDGYIASWLNGWMDGQMDRAMDLSRVEGWIDKLIDVWMN